MPTLKFSGWKPLIISSTAVSAGITSLNSVIAVLERANSFTLQKLNRKYTITSAAAISRPAVLSSPWPPGTWWYRSLAQSHFHDDMYCAEASASTEITETIAIQFAHAAMKPTSDPCE